MADSVVKKWNTNGSQFSVAMACLLNIDWHTPTTQDDTAARNPRSSKCTSVNDDSVTPDKATHTHTRQAGWTAHSRQGAHKPIEIASSDTISLSDTPFPTVTKVMMAAKIGDELLIVCVSESESVP